MNEKEINIPRLTTHHEKQVHQKPATSEMTDHLSEHLGGQILEYMFV